MPFLHAVHQKKNLLPFNACFTRSGRSGYQTLTIYANGMKVLKEKRAELIKLNNQLNSLNAKSKEISEDLVRSKKWHSKEVAHRKKKTQHLKEYIGSDTEELICS